MFPKTFTIVPLSGELTRILEKFLQKILAAQLCRICSIFEMLASVIYVNDM